MKITNSTWKIDQNQKKEYVDNVLSKIKYDYEKIDRVNLNLLENLLSESIFDLTIYGKKLVILQKLKLFWN